MQLRGIKHVNELATKANLAPGTVYHCFEGKHKGLMVYAKVAAGLYLASRATKNPIKLNVEDVYEADREQLYDWMRSAGVGSVEKLAKVSGLGAATIVRLLRGTSSSLATYEGIANALGVRLSWLAEICLKDVLVRSALNNPSANANLGEAGLQKLRVLDTFANFSYCIIDGRLRELCPCR